MIQVVRFTQSANKLELLLEFRRYRLAFRHPVRTSRGLWAEREGLYVRLEAADGRAGYGEAAPVPGFGDDSVDAAEAACRAIGARVEPEALRALPDSVPSLRNAISCALRGARDAQPGPSLSVAALLPAGRSALAVAPGRAEMGFRVFKWKVGVGRAEDEIAILDDLVAAVPAGSLIRLDANGAWDRRTAGRWLARASERPVEFVEQPVAGSDPRSVDTLLGLASDYPVPLALDESLVCDSDLGGWLDRGWKGYFVVKPSLLGDPDQALERLARAGARVVFSSALETALGARESLGRAFAWTGARSALGFGVWPLFADARFDGPPVSPFIAPGDINRINPEALWNALS